MSPQSDARVLLFSQRGVRSRVSRGASYEFEDVIASVDRCDLVTPAFGRLGPFGERLISKTGRKLRPIHRLNPGMRAAAPTPSYDLLVAVFQFATDALTLNAVPNWRKRCRTAVCWLEEMWVRDIENRKAHLAVLSKFDLILTNCLASCEAVRKATGVPCEYRPPGIDTMLFCPGDPPPERVIDILNVGRRSEQAHDALLRAADERNWFYYYDTVVMDRFYDHAVHRRLLASLIQRSKYFIANAAKFNLDRETGGQSEIGFRFLEGVAGGAVLIGQPPTSPAWAEQFDWPDAIIEADRDSTELAAIIESLASDPDRVDGARRNNMGNAMLRHDWRHRWADILEAAQLPPDEALTRDLDSLRSRGRAILERVEASADPGV